MKATVSIPDDLFARADALASRLGKSRSQLYREALADYVARQADCAARQDPDAITRAINEVVDEVADDDLGRSDAAVAATIADAPW